MVIIKFNLLKKQINFYNNIFTCLVIIFATNGATIPGIVPAVLVIPINIPAYCGAISIWLILNPACANPLKPTEMVRNSTHTVLLEPRYPTDTRPPPANTNA